MQFTGRPAAAATPGKPSPESGRQTERGPVQCLTRRWALWTPSPFSSPDAIAWTTLNGGQGWREGEREREKEREIMGGREIGREGEREEKFPLASTPPEFHCPPPLR